MPKTTLQFLRRETREAVKEAVVELGLKDPMVFISRAVEDKLLDIRRTAFFRTAERVREGLRVKGIKPETILRGLKT